MINKIAFYGIGGIPCFSSVEEYIEGMKDAKYYTKTNFLKQYNKFIAGLQITTMVAKGFIMDNWKNVKDWTNLEVDIVDYTGKVTEYLNYVKDDTICYSKIIEAMVIAIDDNNKKRHNPVETVEFLLDPLDGDFSVVFNGIEHIYILMINL